LHPSDALNFARLAAQFAQWQAVREDERSDAPGWWWGSALAARQSTTPLPDHLRPTFATDRPLTYSDGAALVLQQLTAQQMLAWPLDFPRKGNDNASSPASSDLAAQMSAS
jgi:hypothetical protein